MVQNDRDAAIRPGYQPGDYAPLPLHGISKELRRDDDRRIGEGHSQLAITKCYGISQVSVSVWAREPSTPTPCSSSSKVCRGTALPDFPTAGIPAHLSAALSVNDVSAAGVSACPMGTHNS